MAAIFQDGRQKATFLYENWLCWPILIILVPFHMCIGMLNTMEIHTGTIWWPNSTMAAIFQDGIQKATFRYKNWLSWPILINLVSFYMLINMVKTMEIHTDPIWWLKSNMAAIFEDGSQKATRTFRYKKIFSRPILINLVSFNMLIDMLRTMDIHTDSFVGQHRR